MATNSFTLNVIKIELDIFREHVSQIDLFIKQKSKELKQKKTNSMKINVYFNVFLEVLWESLFISIYSFFEYELFRLCKKFEQEYENSIKIKEIRGYIFNQAPIYLKKIVKIDFPDKCTEWEKIGVYKIVRNSIVHRQGRLSDSQKNKNRIEKFIKDNPSLLIELDESNNNIKISKETLFDFIETLREFFEKLYTNIPEKVLDT
jgi:hypothetical protein